MDQFMETIQVKLTVKEVVQVLRQIQPELEKKRRRFHPSKPRISCPRLPTRFNDYIEMTLNHAFKQEGLPVLESDPNRENAFEYYTNYYTPQQELAWTVGIRREGEITNIMCMLSDRSPEVGYLWVEFLHFLVEGLQISGQTERVPQEPELPKKHEIYKSNQWLIECYFNNNLTRLQALKDKWLELREEEGISMPSNPLASMRTVINEEKKRRKKAQDT